MKRIIFPTGTSCRKKPGYDPITDTTSRPPHVLGDLLSNGVKLKMIDAPLVVDGDPNHVAWIDHGKRLLIVSTAYKIEVIIAAVFAFGVSVGVRDGAVRRSRRKR